MEKTPQERDDRGQSRSMTDEEQNALIALLESRPKLTATAAMKKLVNKGTIKNEISSSSLSRFVKSHGLTYEERNKTTEEQKSLKFDFFSPLECIQVDVMYGPEIPDEKGRYRKALLIAFLDDATRRVIYSKFSFSEKSLLFEDGIKHILQSHGMIGRLYTDNGSTFVSNQTRRILDIIGIILSHSRSGIPKGQGKVERFFRTVRDQFTRPLDVKEVQNLDDLNGRFHTWLECEYHRSPHRGLKEHLTPLDAWVAKVHHIRTIKPGIDLDRIFLHMHSRRVYKDFPFTLNGTLFEAPSILAGKSINIFFDPHPPVNRILITYGGKEYGDAKIVDSYANTKVKRNFGSSARNLDTYDQDSSELPVNILVTSMGGQ
jgi:putative transposase